MVFTSPVRVKNVFTFKDKLPKALLSGLVYSHKCGGWNATYMLRPNIILKSEFKNIQAFYISLYKMRRLTTIR